MSKVKKLKSQSDDSRRIKLLIKRLYNKSAPLLLCEGLLFGVVAVLMFLKPVVALVTLTIVIGVALILFGLYRTISGFAISRSMGEGWLDIFFGLVNVILGILFCIFPVGSIISLVYIFVVLFFFKSLATLIFSINMLRTKFGHYKLNLVISMILTLLAALLLVFPMAGAVAMIYYLAATLLMYAVADIYMYVEVLKLKKLV